MGFSSTKFGRNNLIGEIIWQRHNAHNDAKKKLAVLKDTILYYSKSDNFIYNPVYIKLNEKYTGDFYKYDDGDGKGLYQLGDLTNTRPGGYDYEYKGYKPGANSWRCPVETMQEWDAEGLLYFPKSKNQRLRIKRYFNNSRGQLIGDVWIQRYDKPLFEKNKAAGKPVGHIIAFSFGKGTVSEVARLKNKDGIIIDLKKVNDIVDYGSGPKVSITSKELEDYKYLLEASAESDAGIEFYSWDFDHKPEEGFKADVVIDKDGKQVKKFEPGEHCIAVEAVDKEGRFGWLRRINAECLNNERCPQRG
jgi:hypothetical protein